MKSKVLFLLFILIIMTGCQNDYQNIGNNKIKLLISEDFQKEDDKYIYKFTDNTYCSYNFIIEDNKIYDNAKEYLLNKYNITDIHNIEIDGQSFYHYEGKLNGNLYSYYSTILDNKIYTAIFFDNSDQEYCLNAMYELEDNIKVNK